MTGAAASEDSPTHRNEQPATDLDGNECRRLINRMSLGLADTSSTLSAFCLPQSFHGDAGREDGEQHGVSELQKTQVNEGSSCNARSRGPTQQLLLLLGTTWQLGLARITWIISLLLSEPHVGPNRRLDNWGLPESRGHITPAS